MKVADNEMSFSEKGHITLMLEITAVTTKYRQRKEKTNVLNVQSGKTDPDLTNCGIISQVVFQ